MELPVKILFLLIAAVSQYVGVKPPNPPAGKDDKLTQGTWFEKHVRGILVLSGILAIINTMVESIVLLLLSADSPLLSTLCPLSTSKSTSLAHFPNLTPSFLLGVGLTFSGSALRFWCYQALGSHFTIEISIKPDHKLVTSGPYAYVRHPSYTGSVFVMIGSAFLMSGPDSYMHQCLVMSTPVRTGLVVTLLLSLVLFAVFVLGRSNTEEEGLKKAFGQSWVRYNHLVPYKFIPHIV